MSRRTRRLPHGAAPGSLARRPGMKLLSFGLRGPLVAGYSMPCVTSRALLEVKLSVELHLPAAATAAPPPPPSPYRTPFAGVRSTISEKIGVVCLARCVPLLVTCLALAHRRRCRWWTRADSHVCELQASGHAGKAELVPACPCRPFQIR
eukprot:1217942-Prymnesium_polylepis.1